MKKSVTLDDLDRRILVALQADGSMSNAELAEKVGSTGPSCWRRIRRLEEEGVFLRTVRLIDQQRVGQGVNVICNVRLANYTAEATASFERFVQEESRIMDCYAISGDWDYLIRVVASDVSDYEHFLMRTLLRLPAVASASSHFTLSVTKRETAVPIPSL